MKAIQKREKREKSAMRKKDPLRRVMALLLVLTMLLAMPSIPPVLADTGGGLGTKYAEELVPNEAYVSALRVDDYITGTADFDKDDDPGNDSTPENMIVRSFDSVTYLLWYGVNLQGQVGEATYFEEGDMFVRFVLPDTTKDKANFNLSGMLWLLDPTIEYGEDGGEGDPDKNDIVVTGRYRMQPAEGGKNSIPGEGSLSVLVDVFAMNHGSTLKPVFYAWMDGYDAEGTPVLDNVPQKAVADPVTVSAKLALNVELARNSYVSVLKESPEAFDFEDTANTGAVNYGEGDVSGRMLAYGMSLAIANSEPTRGFKGLELPTGPITFDIELDAFKSDANTTTPVLDSILDEAMPLLWAYRPNNSYGTSSDPADDPTGRNMHWPPIGQTNNFIAGGAIANNVPYNSGGVTSLQNRVPDGGTWTIVQDSDPLKANVYHVTVSGYTFLNAAGEYQWPLKQTNTAEGSAPKYGEALGTGVFSAGNLQVLFPMPESGSVVATTNYYLEVQDTNLKASSATDPNAVRDQVKTNDDRALDNFTLYPKGSYSELHAFMTPEQAKSPGQGSSPYGKYSSWDVTRNVSTENGYGADGWMPYGSDVIMIAGPVASTTTDNDHRIYSFDLLQKFDAKWLQPHDGASTTPDYKYQTETIPLQTFYVSKADGTNWESDSIQNNTSLADLDTQGFKIYQSMADLRADTNGLAVGQTERLCVAVLYVGRGGDDKCVLSYDGYFGTKMTLSDDPASIGHVSYQTGTVAIWTKEKSKTLPEAVLPAQGASTTYGALVSAGTRATQDALIFPKTYSKTEYDENGTVVTGSNNGGRVYGASLLHVGNIATISKSVDQEKEPGMPKDVYNIIVGQRRVDYVLRPELTLANPIEAGGGAGSTKPATVTIVDTLPKKVTVNSGTKFYLGGTYTVDDSLNGGSLSGGTEIANESDFPTANPRYKLGTNADGNMTITFTFENITVGGGAIPPIHFSATLGKPGGDENVDEVGVSEVFENTVTITATGDGRAIRKAHSNIATYPIRAYKLGSASLMKTIKEQIVEIGEEVEYIITHNNNSASMDFLDYKLFDVLPYNGDSRGTKFNGTYATEVYLEISGGTESSINVNEVTESQWPEIDDKKTVDDLVQATVTGTNRGTVTPADGEKKITLSAGARAVYLTGTLERGISYKMRVVLKPTDNAGNDIYINDATAATSSDSSVYLYAPPVAAVVVSRTISGVAWVDANLDGQRDIGTPDDPDDPGEMLLPNVAVKLVAGTGAVIKNMHGADAIAITDANGFYKFTDLPPGRCKVIFESNTDLDKFNIGDYGVTVRQAAGVPVALNSDVTANMPADVLVSAETDFYSMPLKTAIGPLGFYEEVNVDAGLFTKNALARIEAKKSATGKDMTAEQFEFGLFNANGGQVATAKNESAGALSAVKFPVITYKQAGTYTYTIKELTTSGAGWICDTNSYTATVTVTEHPLPGDLGQVLTAVVTYEGGEPPTFVNTYEEPSTPLETEPPVTDPPVTDPPVTDPPVTDTPVTDTPVTTSPTTSDTTSTPSSEPSSSSRVTTSEESSSGDDGRGNSTPSGNTISDDDNNNNNNNGKTGKAGDDSNIPVTGSFVPFMGLLLAVAFLAIATVMTTKRRKGTTRTRR